MQYSGNGAIAHVHISDCIQQVQFEMADDYFILAVDQKDNIMLKLRQLKKSTEKSKPNRSAERKKHDYNMPDEGRQATVTMPEVSTDGNRRSNRVNRKITDMH